MKLKKLIAMILVVATLAMMCSVAFAVTIRKGPGTNYKKVFSLSNGAKITVTSTKRTSSGYLWCKIRCGKGSGWVQAKYVSGYKSKWYKKPTKKSSKKKK